MLQPAKTKYRKCHRFRNAHLGVATSGTRLTFGSYGLKAQSGGELNSRQLESARRTITHHLKRGGRVWTRVFPHRPITRKAAEVPMGSGKGAVDFYVASVNKGHIIIEVDGVEESVARRALYLAASKLPVKTKFVISLR